MSELSRISDVIAQDLRFRIDVGQELPCALTIAALAENYNVSQSPVRTAVEQLIEWQFLVKLENGRLEVNDDKLGKRSQESSLEQEVISPADLQRRRDQTFDQIVEHVLRRSWSGKLDFMREEATAEKFRVGRPYVRQVFSELSGRGLLEHIPRRGWRICPFDLDDMCQFLEIREVLECKALLLAKDRLDPRRLQAMLDGNPVPASDVTQSDAEDFADLELNNEIHSYLIQCANNRYIADFFQRNGLYFFKLFDMAAFDLNARLEMNRQHRVILQALLDQDWQLATEALAKHIQSQKPVVGELLERFQGKSPGKESRTGDS